MDYVKKIYVIIPVYNSELYLRKCLNHVFNQSYKNIEVICVNDGSTDSSSSILNEYKNHHSNLIIINKNNGGLSSARNAGLDYVKKNGIEGFLLFIDSDDYVSSEYVESLVNIQLKTGSDIVCSAYYIDDGKNNICKTKNQLRDDTLSTFNALQLLFDGKLQSHAQTKLFSCRIWKDIRFDENVCFMEDQDIMFRALLLSNTVSTTNYCGYYFLMSKDSLCRSKMTNKKILSALHSYKKACDYNYNTLSLAQSETIKKEAVNLFAGIYLMMYGRFSKRLATKIELEELQYIREYVKDNKIIKKYIPKTKKDKIKKFFYLYFRLMYKLLFLISGRV